MDGSGSMLLSDGKNDRTRKRPRDEQKVGSGELRPAKTRKLEQHVNETEMRRNTSGVKSFLHGISYQIKLCIYVCLTNAKRSLNPTKNGDNFSFTVKAEDPTAGKFDDIVYEFRDGDQTGTLKIQAKHTSKSPAPKITLKDFTTTTDTEDPFALQKYFTSFCDQQQSSTDMEGFIICTNCDLDAKAMDMWKPAEPAVTDESATSLDSYVSALFDSIGGKYYQLDYENLWTAHGMFSNFHQLLRKCSKRARLAKVLVEATKPNKKITYSNYLFKEYRHAILHIIDRNETSTNDSYTFTKEFLDSSFSSLMPGYEAFRKEFEDQYREEFTIEGCIWDDLKLKRVHVSKPFLLDEKNQYSSSDSFPDDNVDECFKSFCDRFRLVCGTYGEQGLDDAIAEIWRSLHADYDHMTIGQRKGCLEEKVATERLFKTNFDWLMDPFAKPLHSEDIKKDFENIENTLAHIKLKGISDKLRRKVVTSPFRISHDVLGVSSLYKRVEKESFLQLEAYDIPFGATVISDILLVQGKESILLEESDFLIDSKQAEGVFSSLPLHAKCLIIICNGMVQCCVSKDMFKNYVVQVFLIQKPSNSQSNNHVESVNLSEFRVRDLIKQSLNQFLGKKIPICTTTIFPYKIFQNNFQELLIEQVIKLLDWGKQMEENNEISKKYLEIESTYVHRLWVDEKSKLKTENTQLSENTLVLLNLKELIQKEMSWNKIAKSFKCDPDFDRTFGMPNNPDEEQEPIVDEKGKKVLILMGEAGHGKSTNLTWLAWHLRKRNPSSWVVRCNLSNHCSEFKPFTLDPKKEARKVIDETEAMRMLYKLLRSSLQLEREMAEKCSKYLDLSDGEAIISEDLTLNHGLPLNNSIQLLVFKEKFNAGELILLLDGFDEIAPHYKEVVLKFLSHFEQFKGVRKLYLTSRPYGFKEQFEQIIKEPSFFKLKPLSLHDKGSILFKMMQVKWNNANIDIEEESDFYKSLCYMLLLSLGSMSDVPLNLMMAVDILGDHVYHNENININFSSETFKTKLLETIFQLSKASFTVEEFVEVKIRHRLFDKKGGDKNIADNPDEIERLEKAIDEAKRLHGLLALWVLFNKNERNIIVSANEIREGEDFKKKILQGSEKTGIIHSMSDGRIMFIHYTFVEYLAAWWIVKRQKEENQQDRLKLSCPRSFWERKELQENIDTILAKRHPLHLAIIERNWKIVESLLSTNSESLYEEDDGKRTALHLIACHYDFKMDEPDFLPDYIKSDTINEKEILFGWTALDFAFHRANPKLIYYLLHHGASINVDFLTEQVVSARKDKIREAAKYSRYVMGYLSHQTIEYKSHDACKKMNQFCDKVIADLFNETSANERRIIEDSIGEDAVWLLESIIRQKSGTENFFEMIRNSYFELALESKSILVVKFFMAKDPSILKDDNILKCVVYATLRDYKNEFKYFFDLYCSRLKVKDYQICSIQSYDPGYPIGYLESDLIDKVYDIVNNICCAKLGLPAGVTIDGNTLSLLVTCVATVRPSMLRYLKESCKLNLCASIVYSLGMITDHLLSKIRFERVIKPSKAYECLLNLASNVSDVEANRMLRLAISSNLFDFSKCLMEQYNIDFQAVDESKGWNVLLLHSLNQSSFWSLDEFFGDDKKTNLFRYILAKASDMDCFGIFNNKGRSIFHLAMDIQYTGIAKLIVARKLGFNHLNEIKSLRGDAMHNIIVCFHAIHQISKPVREKWWYWNVLCMICKQIAEISLSIDAQSQEPNRGRLLLQENAKELYQIAVKCRSLFLMYYLRREFPSAIPPPIYDMGWLACIMDSLRSPDFLAVTKWMLNPNEIDQHVNLYEVVEKCDAEGFDLSSVDLEKLVNQVETTLSVNRSVEEVCILKLLALAVCLKNESSIKRLFEALNVNIDWKVLIDIMVIAHKLHFYAPGTKFIDGCTFEKPDFDPIYRYLFERITDLGEIDVDGRNMLHLAVQSGLDCMANLLIKHNLVNVMTTNKQNGWNIFHYYASREISWDCYYAQKDHLQERITNRVLGITSYETTTADLTESRKNTIKELCFNINEGRKSVIQVAVEAGNIKAAVHIIKFRLGISHIDKHEIRDSVECLRCRECYDELIQIAAQLPFNVSCDYLLHCLTKSIHRFAPENVEHLNGNVEDHIVEDAIMYRSVTILEHLMIAHEDQTNKALAKRTDNDLLAWITECIRRNRIGMFKVLVRHYRNLQGIQPRVEIEFENVENDNFDEATLDEKKIKWAIINHLSKDVAMNRDFLSLLILLVAYGRVSLTRFLVEMLQLEVNKSLILLIMKALEKLWDENCKTATPVYEYLASRCEGNVNLLHLCIQAECYNMLEYLIKEKKLDPNEVDSENGWNAGHYYVTGLISSGFEEFTWLVKAYNIDCFNVYDRNGRSIFDLAWENGHDRVVEFIFKNRQGHPKWSGKAKVGVVLRKSKSF